VVTGVPTASELFPCAVVPWIAVRLGLVGASSRNRGHAPDGPPAQRPVKRLVEEQMSRCRAVGADVSAGTKIEKRGRACGRAIKFNFGPTLTCVTASNAAMAGRGPGVAGLGMVYFGRPRKAPSRTNDKTVDPPTSAENDSQHERSGVVDGASVVDWYRPHTAGHEPVMESLRPCASA